MSKYGRFSKKVKAFNRAFNKSKTKEKKKFDKLYKSKFGRYYY